MHHRKLASALGVAALTGASLLASTGIAAASAGHHPRSDQARETYVGTLKPLNAHAAPGIGRAGGQARMTLNNAQLEVWMSVHGVNANSLHPQHIHAGPRCPTIADDTNHDGFVDVIEGLKDYGPILVNLDSNLSDNMAGMFPTPKHSSYRYHETGDAQQIRDEIDQPLILGTRHVVVHGVDPDTKLPSTVQSLPGLPAWATLPVACGDLVNAAH